MKNINKILMLTSESVPYAKTGGLADMVSALAYALDEKGLDVRILMPLYGSIKKTGKRKLNKKISVNIGNNELANKEIEAELRSCTLSGSSVKVYFLENEQLYGRKGIYSDEKNMAYPDNDLRFGFLNQACFEVCKAINWIPDIIHAHDWTASLAAFFLNKKEKKDVFAHTASVLTIHNLGYQGLFPQESLENIGIQWEDFTSSGLAHYQQISFLKSGLTHSDILTTVSPTYAGEIQAPFFGCGMDDLLRRRSGDLYGILNGVDYKDWNPETDLLISPDNYTKEDLSGKQRCKERLQKSCGFKVDSQIPLIGIVSRLVEQKGFDALLSPEEGCLEGLCHEIELQVVILGSGEARYEEELKRLSEMYKNLQVFNRFDNKLAHLIEAGSDFFLMPSLYEPCGLNQMYSLKYGTLPIVRSTGGLADTVKNYNELTGEGTGFMFHDLNPSAIFNTVGWAIWAWYNKKKDIKKMRSLAMDEVFPWSSSAEKYREIYSGAIERKLGVYPRSW